MASAARRPLLLLLIFFLALSWPPAQPAHGLLLFGVLGRWSTLVSLSHSLMLRVANARAERGDLAGAARAHMIAQKIHTLGDGGGGILSLGWDYLSSYDWRDGTAGGLGEATGEIRRAANEVLAALRELGRMKTDGERKMWAARSYAELASAVDSLLRRLSQTISRSEPVKEAVVVVQKEVVEGDLLRYCLEVGAKGLEGLIRIAQDLFSS